MMKEQVNFSNVGRVGVLFGGVSAERAVSLESGQAIVNALTNLGVNAVPIDVQENVVEQLLVANIDIAFIALHGGIGEDGRLQALLDILKIPYTGSDSQSSTIAMNKLFSKRIWLGMGIPTSPFVVLDDNTDFHQALESLGGSAIVKPAHEGSSIGMSIVRNVAELELAYKDALQYDTAIFAEKLLSGSEYTVSIVNGRILPAIKLETDNAFYDYEAKYINNDTRYICPCGLSEEQETTLRELSAKAFDSLSCRGWGRADVMVDEHGQFQVLEVNTVPGMTSHSLVPMAAKAVGIEFDELVSEILRAGLQQYKL